MLNNLVGCEIKKKQNYKFQLKLNSNKFKKEED